MQLGYIANTDYKLTLTPGNAVDIATGLGVDMSDSLFPKFRTQIFGEGEAFNQGSPTDLIIDRCTVYESTEYKEEARKLATSFSAHFGVTTGNAAYSKARNEVDTKKIFYIEIAQEGEGMAIDKKDIIWESSPIAESLEDPKDILDQFLLDSGSHYINRVYYGKLIIIRAAIKTTSISERDSFSASVNAAAVSWGGEASLSSSHEQVLRSSNVELVASIISGGVIGLNLALTSYEDIKVMIEKIKNGTIQIQNGPVRCDVTSLWHTVSAYPKIRRALSFPKVEPIQPIFGVPKGTIIAWYPSPESIIFDDVNTSQIKSIVMPAGWTICDGKNNTPNLVGNFIRGIVSPSESGLQGGQPSHFHTCSGITGGETNGMQGPNEGADNYAGKNWQHQHNFSASTSESSNIPPYIGLIYIMKL